MINRTIRLLILSFILFSSIGYSQEQAVRLGLKISPNLTWMNPNEKNYTNNGVAAGVSFGFVSEFRLADHYAIVTGFDFAFLGGYLKFPYAKSPDTGIMDRKYNFRYLDIPLMIKMKTKEYGNFRFFGQIGFSTGFLLRTQVTDNFNTQLHGSISDKGNLTTSEVCFFREAVMAGLGAEYKIDESVSLVIGLSYSNSLNNVLQGKNTKDNSLDNRSSLNYAELNIGILF